ncbi:MAG: formate dehydrogenase major subunit, partial [Pirellulaceae bacterium]
MIDSTNKLSCEQDVTLSIDGREVTVSADSTVWEAAQRLGIEVPVLCHSSRLDPVGVCRMCVVDTGERVLAASCVRQCQQGMKVETDSEKVFQHRKMLTSLLLIDHPTPCERERTTGDCQLEQLAREFGLLDQDGNATAANPLSSILPTPASDSGANTATGNRPRIDLSSPVIAVDHQACILCDRCVRACDDIQSNEVIGRSGKGYSAQIGFDLNTLMGESTCVSCGECVSECPTGALTNKKITLPIVSTDSLDSTDSICPYCGVGCAVTFHATDNQIVFTEGRESPVNDSRLCVKGRYGFDYATHPQRLTKPLIRRASSYPKEPLSPEVQASYGKGRKPGGVVNYDDVMPAFREATWEEALDLVAQRLLA